MHDSIHDSFMHLILVRCAPEKNDWKTRAAYCSLRRCSQSSILTQKKLTLAIGST